MAEKVLMSVSRLGHWRIAWRFGELHFVKLVLFRGQLAQRDVNDFMEIAACNLTHPAGAKLQILQ